jgi:hypothetical protein
MVQAEGQEKVVGANEHSAHNATEAALFMACTKVTVENGKDTNFWHDHWLLGQAHKNIVPAVYKLAWQKNITIAQGIRDDKLKRGL